MDQLDEMLVGEHSDNAVLMGKNGKRLKRFFCNGEEKAHGVVVGSFKQGPTK